MTSIGVLADVRGCRSRLDAPQDVGRGGKRRREEERRKREKGEGKGENGATEEGFERVTCRAGRTASWTRRSRSQATAHEGRDQLLRLIMVDSRVVVTVELAQSAQRFALLAGFRIPPPGPTRVAFPGGSLPFPLPAPDLCCFVLG